MSKVILLTIVVLAVIIVVYHMKNKKQNVIIPAESINVTELTKQLENDLDVDVIAIENVSEEELESTTEAIISDLDKEAEESLPESLNPSVSDLAISENDKAELESLLSGDSVLLGAMKSLGLTLSPIEKQKLPPAEEMINLVTPKEAVKPVDVKQLITTPNVDTENVEQLVKPIREQLVEPIPLSLIHI